MDLTTWLGSATSVVISAEQLIDLKPLTVTNLRTAASLEIRLETWVNRQKPTQTEGGVTSEADAIVFCNMGANIQRGDQFQAEGRLFEIISILPGFVGVNIIQAFAIVRD